MLESDEYIQFCEIRDKVKEDPQLWKQINDFRLHVFEVQASQEPLDLYGEQERLCRQYEEFRKNPMVSEFLQSELRVCRILQKVVSTVADAVDIDVPEISERIGL